jgi:hypothetical protein
MRNKMSKLCSLLVDYAKRVVNLMLLGMVFAQMAPAAPTNTMYVATNACGTGDGTNWANATSNLQWAIDTISSSSPTNTVWVSNGVYNTGGRTNYYPGMILTTRVAIWKAITVRSANNDPTNTIIVGAKDPATNGPAAVRCVYMHDGSCSLIGFTLTNGATLVSGGSDINGGGVFCNSSYSPIISNCVIAGNFSGGSGGGAHFGTLYNCTLVGNSAVGGGGGGAWYSTLYNCTVVSNRASGPGNGGGGVYAGTCYNCLIAGNSATLYGGGVERNSACYNCTIVGNSCPLGGGVGGSSPSTFVNCIVYNNNPGGTNNWRNTSSIFTNSCTYPTQTTWTASMANITNDPSFVNTNVGNYRLGQGSPCINAGLNQSWMSGALDLDGRSRIDHFNQIVDMGCYEFLPSGMLITVP